MGKTFTIRTCQVLPVSLAEAWHYFSNPHNLKEITPPYMGFDIISKHHGDMLYPGQIIEYTVKPVLGLPLYWMTEITHVQPMQYFIDEQRYGPYSLWHHQHHFAEKNGQVEMTDIVHYRLPMGFLGSMANSLFVRNELKRLFDFRRQQIEKIFGTAHTPDASIISMQMA